MTASRRTEITYGTGTAIIASAALALIDGASDTSAAATIETGLRSGRALEDVMADLSALGFALLPPFAIVVATAGSTIRLIHRGQIEVSVLDSEGALTSFYQPSVSTWREEAIDGVVEVRASIRRLSAPGEPTHGEHWLRGTGVLPADAVVWCPPSAFLAEVGTADVDESASIDRFDRPRVVVPHNVVPAVVGDIEVLDAPRSGMVPDSPAEAAPVAAAPDLPPYPAPRAVIEPVENATKPPVAAEPDISEPVWAPVASVDQEIPPEIEIAEPPVSPVLIVVPVPGEADDLDFAHFVDHTVFRRAEEAAVRPVEHEDDAPSPTVAPLDLAPSVFMSLDTLMPERTRPPGTPMIGGVPGLGTSLAGATPHTPDTDHDGHTVARPRRRSAPSSASTPAAADGGVMVQSVFCSQGHPNPASGSTCRSCGLPITDRAARMHERPSLGELRFSTGQSVTLLKPLLIGRNPPPSQKLDGHAAQVIEIDNSELSRLHAAVHLVEWHVHIDDQGSTNGTVVTLPGRPPQTLRPFEKLQISVGTVVDLGGAVSFSFDRV